MRKRSDGSAPRASCRQSEPQSDEPEEQELTVAADGNNGASPSAGSSHWQGSQPRDRGRRGARASQA
eukprot:15481821-Alexandrium_andersonii.AAC.1